MGEEREDPQKLKKLAADSYDYDADSRWPDYWANVLIPPNMASRSDVVSHYKRKFYQRHVVSPKLSSSFNFSSVSALGSLPNFVMTLLALYQKYCSYLRLFSSCLSKCFAFLGLL